MEVISPIFLIVLITVLTYTFPLSEHPFASMAIIIAIPIYLYTTFKAGSVINQYLMRQVEQQEEIQTYNELFQLQGKEMLDVRSLYHNIRHERVAMQGMLKKGNVDEALNELEKQLGDMVSHLISYTGIIGIDSIMNAKAQEAAKHGITIKFECRRRDEKNDMGTFELSYIFGNLMDNAIKAICSIENPSEKDKEIAVELHMGINLFSLTVQNACYRTIRYGKDGLPISSQEGKEHGYGLYTIRQIVEEHKGKLTIEQKDNTFIVDILLYQKL